MLKNYIKEAIRLNKISLDKFQGVKVHYRKSTLYTSLVCIVFLMAILSIGWKESFAFILFIYMFLIYVLTEIIGKIMTKNPVFIVEEGKIYYLKSNKWYKIQNYNFKDTQMGRTDWFQTFCMVDRKGKIVVSEKNLWLKNIDALRDAVKWIQLPEEQKEKIRERRNRIRFKESET